MKNIASFKDLTNTLGKPGAWLLVAVLLMGLAILPLLIVGLFFLALKFTAWAALSFFAVL